MGSKREMFLNIGVGILVIILVVFGIFYHLLYSINSPTVTIINDTSNTYAIGRVYENSDDHKIKNYLAKKISSGDTFRFVGDSGFESTVCLVIKDQGSVYFDVPQMEFLPNFYKTTSTRRENMIGDNMSDYTVKISDMLSEMENHPCPYLEYIGKVPPDDVRFKY